MKALYVQMMDLYLIFQFLTRSANLPEGLYILCALVSSFFFFYYEQSYLSIYFTDFHDLLTKWKVFA